MNRLNTPQKKWGCGTIAVVILMVCGAIYLIPQFLGGNDSVEPTNIPNSGNPIADNSSSNISLGSLEIAEQIDRDGCAFNRVSSFGSVQRFYVVAPNSSFPAGTTVFARLYRDGVAVEDLPMITANQAYSNSCINFVFETVNGASFESGTYEAEFWVNGNSYNSISFNIN